MITEDRAIAIDATYRVLDQYAGGIVDEPPRIEAIATISAGAKNDKGLPIRSTDGRIFLHDPNDRAPELARILALGDCKRLTVAFPFNDPGAFVQQRFAAYSASALLAYGDEKQITVLEGGRRVLDAGSKEYELWAKKCKVQASIYFCLSEWVDDTPLVSMPDGLGYYRLRTTSRNSLRSILSALHYAATFTRGQIAGLPFTLSIEQRDVAMSDGKRQRVPVWVAVTQPPGGVHLTSRTFAAIARRALDEGSALFLPAPSGETLETAMLEAGTPLVVDEDAPLSDEELALLQRGGRCDVKFWNARWHAVAAGTVYEAAEARHGFIARFTSVYGPEPTESLHTFLAMATEADANALISALELATQDGPGTGELAMTPEEADAAESLKAELFDGEIVDDVPEPEQPPAPEFDPADDITRFHAYVKKRGAAGSIQVQWDRAHAIGDLLASVLQSGGAGIDIARFLVDTPQATYQSLTVAQADGLMKLADLPKARERLMGIHALAQAWLVARQTAAKDAAAAMV